MDIGNIYEQIDASKKTFEELNQQNRIFGTLLQEAVKGAPESDKKKIEEIRLMYNKTIKLAKSGKINEAQEIIGEMQKQWASK